MCNMNKSTVKYKKINAREFRHRFSVVKDSLLAGQAYQVTFKNLPLAYVIPAQHDISVKKRTKTSKKEFAKLTAQLSGSFDLKTRGKNHKEIYRKLLEKKHQ